jgi:hypothetical protein
MGKERESQIARSLTMMKEKQGNPKMHGRKRRKKENRREKKKYIYTKCTLNSLNSENSLAEKDKQKDRPKKRENKKESL